MVDKYDKPSWLDNAILKSLKKRVAAKQAKKVADTAIANSKKAATVPVQTKVVESKPKNNNRTDQIQDTAMKNFGTDLQAELKKLRERGKK